MAESDKNSISVTISKISSVEPDILNSVHKTDGLDGELQNAGILHDTRTPRRYWSRELLMSKVDGQRSTANITLDAGRLKRDLSTANADKPKRDLSTANADKLKRDLSTVNVHKLNRDLSTANADKPKRDLSTANADKPKRDLSTVNVDKLKRDLSTANADKPKRNLSTVNVDKLKRDLSTANADKPKRDLSTANADKLKRDLSTASADKLKRDLSTANWDKLKRNLCTANADKLKRDLSSSSKIKHINNGPKEFKSMTTNSIFSPSESSGTGSLTDSDNWDSLSSVSSTSPCTPSSFKCEMCHRLSLKQIKLKERHQALLKKLKAHKKTSHRVTESDSDAPLIAKSQSVCSRTKLLSPSNEAAKGFNSASKCNIPFFENAKDISFTPKPTVRRLVGKEAKRIGTKLDSSNIQYILSDDSH
ncbi:uncharacterized protein LOC106075041 [Biomphalaria glabrata]|uniref:Uncharacterized protein LOC106075041 n=1 Tax=Biomphalaria glabrata TaxID=6526 RepID=A0A9U8EKI1_BIOGL|nr:uncharacterized protein LOC106075041 [Biomphalaria glabrata]